ncbi:hypothetical protein EJ05DRAFT_513418 [Pseudovirgaria hyperparasitica]|uniref:HOOK N-terminal domain-containing protein n=1 Tax=Pseudovirgaria hyperparasitica TaxID=470096 RepID=A0A6A6VXY0_9PEZI|nr:uncharacterized protein EJ05DRAFT_513418 [Pseudovirgaria hyperparasitica]KAF2755103.1 hypothetical protein EJ05DRAFT_513418 [Pseudovirgaria hyperparasitica]
MERPAAHLERALLEWVNTCNMPHRVSKWKEFEDGQLLWSILVDIDPEWFSGDLPEGSPETTSNWIPRWQNLKHIDRLIRSYLTEKLNKLPNYSKNVTPDLKAIADGGAPPHTMQMLKVVVYMAVISPVSVQRQLAQFEKLDKNSSSSLIDMIKDMDESDTKLAVSGADRDATSDIGTPASRPASRNELGDNREPIERDRELEYEENLIQAKRRARGLEDQVHNLERELMESRTLIANLEEQVNDTRFSVEREIEEKRAKERLEQLSRKEMSDRNLIADLETELNEARGQLESQKRQIDRLNKDAESKQELRDEIQMLKVERDELGQKTKANENLKKKIQSLQDIERKYQSLLQDSEESRTRLDEFDKLQKRCDGLSQANNENGRMIQNLEQQLLTSEERRRILQQEKRFWDQETEEKKELYQRQVEENEELKAQIRDMHAGAATQPLSSNLDDELAGHDDSEVQPDTGKVDLSDEDSPGIFVLKQKLQQAEEQNERLKERWLKSVEDNQGLLNTIEKQKDVENSDPYVKQRNQLLSVEGQLESLRSDQMAAGVENAELRDKLSKNIGADATGEALDAATQERFDAVQCNLDKTIEEYKAVKQHYDSAVADLHDTKGLLHAVIALKADDESLTESEIARILGDELEAIDSASKEERKILRQGFVNKVASQLQGSRERVEKVNKRLEEASTSWDTMKKELEQAKKDNGVKSSDAARQELENLQRENKLMTSAWYSITTRLQSNTVVLARRTEAPKSWIRRQQAVVGGVHTPRR